MNWYGKHVVGIAWFKLMWSNFYWNILEFAGASYLITLSFRTVSSAHISWFITSCLRVVCHWSFTQIISPVRICFPFFFIKSFLFLWLLPNKNIKWMKKQNLNVTLALASYNSNIFLWEWKVKICFPFAFIKSPLFLLLYPQ